MTVNYASTLSTSRLPVATEPWVRPTEWMALPTIPAGDQRVYILSAVVPGSDPNYFSVRCSGNYRIDYGDGGGWVNYTSATNADRQLSWSSYADNPTTAEGWRQALITIEPQPGQNLTSIDLQRRHASAGAIYTAGFLDMQVSGTSISSMFIGGPSSNPQSGPTTLVPFLSRVGVQGATSITSAASMFRYCYGLRTVEGTQWTSVLTSTANMFDSCYRLTSVPLFDLSSVTSSAGMFVNCSSLSSVPAFNMPALTNAATMFSGCRSLTSTPAFTVGALTTTDSMFQSCSALTSVGLFNTATVTDMDFMFDGCSALQSVPAFNTSACVTMGTMFRGCVSLTTVPSFNTSACVSSAQMFQNCSRLTSVTLNLASATTTTSMLSGASSLQTVTLNSMGNVVSASSMFGSNGSLTSVVLNGMRQSVTVSGNQLNAAALDALYTSLGTAASGATVTVTTNPGTTGDNPAIATAKGWTVTGS